jgi:hypothetical protein
LCVILCFRFSEGVGGVGVFFLGSKFSISRWEWDG